MRMVGAGLPFGPAGWSTQERNYCQSDNEKKRREKKE
jgi:hypothetical protein